MKIQLANSLSGSILCADVEQRDDISRLLHRLGITHITSGKKNYQDYLRRSEKNIYPPDHLVISLYGGDFFSVLDKNSLNYPVFNASQFLQQ